MKKNPLISIIMPTYNSEKTIKLSLESIRKQSFDQKRIEILVIDGGSIDKTLEIAKEYRCEILHNKKTHPEVGKYLGLLKARGKYAIFLDSDEMFDNKYAIKKRIEALENNKEIKILLTGGYSKYREDEGINSYIRTFSDPFSFFMYGISPDSRLFSKQLQKRYKTIKETTEMMILSLKKNNIFPLVDLCAGNTIDLSMIKRKYNKFLMTVNIIPELFYLIVTKTRCFGVLKNESIFHDTTKYLGNYINKLKWRIIVNIHYKNELGVGFANREVFQPVYFSYKKYLFMPYALSLLPPLIISIYYIILFRDLRLLLHFPLTVFVAFYIIYQYILKLFNITPYIRSYG